MQEMGCTSQSDIGLDGIAGIALAGNLCWLKLLAPGPLSKLDPRKLFVSFKLLCALFTSQCAQDCNQTRGQV